jgi:hypothetical protein
LHSPNQKEVAPAKQLGTSTEAQKQASIADVICGVRVRTALADFGMQLNQVMVCIQQLPRPLTRAAIREEIEAGIKRECLPALSAHEPNAAIGEAARQQHSPHARYPVISCGTLVARPSTSRWFHLAQPKAAANLHLLRVSLTRISCPGSQTWHLGRHATRISQHPGPGTFWALLRSDGPFLGWLKARNAIKRPPGAPGCQPPRPAGGGQDGRCHVAMCTGVANRAN